MVAMEICAALTVDTFEVPDLAVQCALLHDTIEDTPVSYEDIAQAFGIAVADGVMALTKRADLPKPDAMADSIRRIKTQPREVWSVKLADRITNLQPPPEKWPLSKRSAYCDEAVYILGELGSASGYLAGRLNHKIESYRSGYCRD
jgi:(p)ppGpp synthase/HD superfamily hydrolase